MYETKYWILGYSSSLLLNSYWLVLAILFLLSCHLQHSLPTADLLQQELTWIGSRTLINFIRFSVLSLDTVNRLLPVQRTCILVLSNWSVSYVHCVQVPNVQGMPRQLKGPVKKETKAEKRRNKADNLQLKQQFLTTTLPLLFLVVFIVVIIVYFGTRN